MKIWRMFVLTLFLFYLTDVFAQTSNIRVPANAFPEIQRISAESAYLKYRSGRTVFADANTSRTFVVQHILGSINLPNDGPEDIERVRKMNLPFPKDKEIILYCQ